MIRGLPPPNQRTSAAQLAFFGLMDRKAASRSPRPRIGCGFLIVSALLTCVLLGINGLIVMNLVNAVLPTLPGIWRHQTRLGQAVVFVGPLILLLIEWWICDVVIDWLRPLDRSHHTPRDDASRGA